MKLIECNTSNKINHQIRNPICGKICNRVWDQTMNKVVWDLGLINIGDEIGVQIYQVWRHLGTYVWETTNEVS
jgi:hypothetical protein